MLVLVMTKQQYGGEMWMNSRKNNNWERASLSQSFDCRLFYSASSCLENLNKNVL